MIITFYGGAQTVTGSKHLITLESGTRILLDCGMFQGKDTDMNFEFGFEPDSVDYLILSHAHIDHSGLIPRLVKKGFKGKICCTPPTLELCRLVLADSAHIQEDDPGTHGKQAKREEALYTAEDVEACLKQFVPVAYNKEYQVNEEVTLLFTDAGHVLGSAVVNLRLQEKGKTRSLCFSGDVGRFSNRILNPPQEFPQADIIICESTYGDRFHQSIQDTEERLRKIVYDTCIEKKGKVLIPAFSIGRTQELVYSLNYLAEEHRLPKVNVFVDSPLSVYATDVVRNHHECFNRDMMEYIKFDPDPFGFSHLHYITDVEDSKLLNAVDEPCVIISSSGMMQAGRIVHHLKNNIADEKNTILITGYCEPSTLGGKLMHEAAQVEIMGTELPVKAEVVLMKEYSAHADYGDFLKFLFCQDKEKIKRIFLVHGEKTGMEKFKASLNDDGYQNVEIAQYMVSYEV